MNIKWVGAKKTVYDALGGNEWFEQLVEHFYESVEKDERIRHLYPDDLTLPKKKHCRFSNPILGRPLNLFRQARTPTLTNATRPISDRPRRTKCMDGKYDKCTGNYASAQ